MRRLLWPLSVDSQFHSSQRSILFLGLMCGHIPEMMFTLEMRCADKFVLSCESLCAAMIFRTVQEANASAAICDPEPVFHRGGVFDPRRCWRQQLGTHAGRSVPSHQHPRGCRGHLL